MSIGTKIKSFLKDAWDSLQQPHGPYYPSPEVKRYLENKGWEYKASLAASPYQFATAYSIRTPEGDLVGRLFGGQETTDRYIEAYEQAVTECAKQTATAPTQEPGPK